MTISVGICAQDEGRDLEFTVANAWASCPAPDEIIVVDDGSSRSIQPRLNSFPGVRVIRHERPMGVHAAIRTYINNSSGDISILLGGHIRMPLDWLKVFAQELEAHPNALICPVTRGFNHNSRLRGSGASFTHTGNLPWAGVKWMPRLQTHGSRPVPAILGACYGATAETWKAMGGPHPCHRGWGYSDTDLSLRAWAAGLECRCVYNLVVAHRFGRPKVGKAAVKNKHPAANLLHTISAIYGENELKRISESVRRVHGDRPIIVFDRQRRDDLIERERFQALMKVPVEDLPRLCGFRLPTDAELQEIENDIRNT